MEGKLIASNSVMEIAVRDDKEFLFSCKGTQKSEMHIGKYGSGKLVISDLFIDIGVLKDILADKYRNKRLSISCENVYKNSETYDNYVMRTYIENAYIDSFTLLEQVESYSRVIIGFRFFTKDDFGRSTVSVEIEELN